MKKALFGLAKSEDQAVSILNQLKGEGFSDNDISVLLPDKTGNGRFAHAQHIVAIPQVGGLHHRSERLAA